MSAPELLQARQLLDYLDEADASHPGPAAGARSESPALDAEEADGGGEDESPGQPGYRMERLANAAFERP